MKKILTFLALLLFGAHVQAGFIFYEGGFSGVFPEGSDLHSIAASWIVRVDDAPPISGVSGLGTKNGTVISISYEVKAPSPPAGPIPIPYPNDTGPVVVNCDINPGSCVLDPDLDDCDSEPNGCILRSVKLGYSFGTLTGLGFSENGVLLLEEALTGFGIRAVYLDEQALSSFAYVIAKDGDDVPSIVNAVSYSGSFREISNIPEPATLTLMGLGLAGIGYRRHRSKKAV